MVGKAASLPGVLSRKALLDRFMRVNQAGEIGAVRIYQGQLAVLRNSKSAPQIKHMAEQERHHVQTFDRLISENNVRPTVFAPLWHVAGFALGAATALMGEKAAMACTVAVEEVIDGHYAKQVEQLGAEDADLKTTIETFQAEEVQHRDIGLANGAEQAFGYPLLSAAIKTGCKAAIWLAERF